MSSALTEEEQLDNLKSLTKKYGSAIVSGVLIALIAFFGWNYWQKKQLVTGQNETARVQQLMDQAQSASMSDKNAMIGLVTSADAIVSNGADTAQAIQAELVVAKAYSDRGDYASAERALMKVQGSKVSDEGLIALVNLHLAYVQIAEKKYDEAVKTLDLIKLPSFKATVDEARGDIFVYKNDVTNARTAYQNAWKEAVEHKQQPQILRTKLESVGILVNDPDIESPILKTQADDS
ncbi:YfgM family protein [Acinetobacter nectaris]|uniref:YfgM family protein n=1 Tax=Acinetobacter nectaris TaxID=1219382 RepID=UPI001F25A8DC|nr:tetratricopeptide repeat protein [Acinetobacter nectaris]MCF9046797.1 tetratricopeptide repeat protein [Acinetobacter nectaris]